MLISGDRDNSNYEVFIEEGNRWLNVSPNESNTFETLPKTECEESTIYLFTKILDTHYYGTYTEPDKSMRWQKVDLPVKAAYDFCFSKSMFFTELRIDDGVSRMSLFKGDITKMLNKDADAVTKVLEDVVLPKLHCHNDTLIFQSFKNTIYMYDGSSFSGYNVNNLDVDDYLVTMRGAKNKVLHKTRKGRVFKSSFNDEMTEVKSCIEITGE